MRILKEIISFSGVWDSTPFFILLLVSACPGWGYYKRGSNLDDSFSKSTLRYTTPYYIILYYKQSGVKISKSSQNTGNKSSKVHIQFTSLITIV